MTRVRCYAGTRYPERPTALEWEGCWLDVLEVLGQSRSPHGLAFEVVAEDHQRYRLVWHEADDLWTVVRVSRGEPAPRISS